MRSLRFLLAAALMLVATAASAQAPRYRSAQNPYYANHGLGHNYGYGATVHSRYYTPYGSSSYDYSASSPYWPVYTPVYPVYAPPVYGSYYWWFSW